MTLTRRLSLTCCFLLAAIGATSFAQSPSSFDLPVQPLATALRAVASQTGTNVLFDPPLVEGKTAPALKAQLSAKQAYEKLLGGTGLTLRTLDEKTVMVVSRESSRGAGDSVRSEQAETPADESKEVGKKSSQEFRVAQVDQRKDTSASSIANQASNTQDGSNSPPSGLSEIIVTAQKREERLQDVPVPVTVIAAETLLANNQLRIQDYFASVPGLNVVPQASSSYQSLSIRGITTSVSSNPTVGVTVDDVPYGSSTWLGGGGGSVIPDIDPAELSRVEVLRGPQGTLYGASSMGGLLKFVTVDPSTEAVSGRIQADANDVYNGAQLGYGVRGSVNVPLSDTLAVRASGFTRRGPGYIDNPVLHIDGVNEQRVSGGRLSALWRPSDAFSLKLSALYQDTKGGGASDVDAPTPGYPQTNGLGDLQQNYLLGTGAYTRKVQAYSATLSAKLGSVDVTAVSGYNVNSFSDSYDVGYFYSSLVAQEPLFGGVSGSSLFEKNKTSKFTQELRLSAPIGQSFEWLLGAFYTHENSQYADRVLAENTETGAIVGDALDTSFPSTYAEYAVFGDLTYRITNRFDVQFGGRESRIQETYRSYTAGPFVSLLYPGSSSPIIVPDVSSSANAFTYLVTPRFKVSPDFMVYARLASGYRAGGANYSATNGTPSYYSPDKTQNYEIGTKGDFFKHMLSVDVSIYYIDWKDIQLSLTNPQTGTSYVGNGSRAKSQGVELSAELKPLTGLTIAGWVDWDDAVLTQALPTTSSVYGSSGDRLPYSSRFSGNMSLEEDFPLSRDLTGFVGGTVSYVGNRVGELAQTFTGSTQRGDLAGYAKTDFRAGAKYQSWTATLFVNNIADKRGLLSGGLGAYPPFAFQYIQPRTVGLSLFRTF